jgi:hypothetical protein
MFSSLKFLQGMFLQLFTEGMFSVVALVLAVVLPPRLLKVAGPEAVAVVSQGAVVTLGVGSSPVVPEVAAVTLGVSHRISSYRHISAWTAHSALKGPSSRSTLAGHPWFL